MYICMCRVRNKNKLRHSPIIVKSGKKKMKGSAEERYW